MLLLALLPAVTIAATLAGYGSYRTGIEFERDLRDFGIGLSRQLAAVAGFSTYSRDTDALRLLAQAALGEPNVVAAVIFDAEGTPIASAGPSPAPLSPIPLDDRPLVIASDTQMIVFAAPIFPPRYDAIDPLIAETSGARPVAPSSGTIGWITLALTREAALERRRETLFVTVLSSLLVLALGGGLAIVLGRQVTRPIVRLERAVARIQNGELDARVPADSGGDLQRLEEGMNAMAEALYEGRAQLEQRVNGATRELQTKKDEAERASAAKSRFLAAASHDLRQPLHALTLFSADLLRAAETREEQRLAARINESVGAMSELLDALLDISRLDIGGAFVQPSPLVLGDLFVRLASGFARTADARGVRLRCRPSSLCIITDAALLERLLGNLVANAIRYTDHGSVLVAARRRGGRVAIEVRDSGIGIAAEHQASIFEEFFQVSNSARVRDEGLGLGLAIVKRLEALLGAQVELRSRPGVGSVFSVSLPLELAPAAADPGAPPANAAGGQGDQPLHLLLALPARPELRALAALAVDWGYACDWINAGDDALAISAGKPALIVAMADDGPAMAGRGRDARLPLVLLGGDSPLPVGAYRLSLPLRPAKLRALLAQLASPV